MEPASKLIVQTFYSDSSPVSTYHNRLFELKRLRNNFPTQEDERDKARMLVAELPETKEIVGFCFLDDRPASEEAYFRK